MPDLQRLHHEMSVLAVVVVGLQRLDNHIIGLEIQFLRRGVADSNLECNRLKALLAEGILSVIEKTFRQTASTVFRSDPQRRDVTGIIVSAHYKDESDHCPRLGDDHVTYVSGVVEKKAECVVIVILASREAPGVQPHDFFESVDSQGVYEVLAHRSRV